MFRFGVACKVADAASLTSSEPKLFAGSATPVRRLHILLAEDNPVNQRIAQRLLERRGHKVSVVGDGREALEAVASQDHFDLVLMDVQMPGMDGLEATAAIRKLADPERRATPIVAMTAFAMKGDRERCLAAGMNGYLTKPIDPAGLCASVERFAGS